MDHADVSSGEELSIEESTTPESGPLSEDRLEPSHPRHAIRTFLRELFEMLGEPLPSHWPDVSATEYSTFRLLLTTNFDGLYEYVEHRSEFTPDQQLMPRYLGETVLYLLELDYEQPESRHEAPPELIENLSDRPEAIIEFDQLYCSPDTTHRRVQRILRDFGDTDAKILFLGDDDLGSVALEPHFSGEIHMIDLDDRLHEYIAEKAPRVQRHKADFIFKGVSPDLHEYFDAVILDPPWDHYRLWCFLDKAIYCLKQSPHARIYFCHCPLLLEHRLRKVDVFQKRIAKRGFTFESIETAFNLYCLSANDLPDFQDRLEKLLPPIESPLLEFIRRIPYAHAQLYVLRRLPQFKMNPIKRFFFNWWQQE